MEIVKKAKEDKLNESTKLTTALGIEKQNEIAVEYSVSEAAQELCLSSNELAQALELQRRIPEEDKKNEED